ncbi:MAG: hypothetical protein ACYCZR_02185 [Burkholderiales bacterium]
MNKITGTVGVWITNDWTTPQSVMKLAADGFQNDAVDKLSYANYDMSGTAGWLRVGTATISIEFDEEKEIISKKAEGLRKEIHTVRAEAQMKVERLEERLSQLLALPNYSEVEA